MKKLKRIAGLLLTVVMIFLCVPQVSPAEAAADLVGDYNNDGVVSDEDVIYLLWYTVFPEDYPLYGKYADFTDNGVVTDEDVIYLLWHTVFPEDYPLEVEPVFKAGFGMVDISPAESVPLAGYGGSDRRMSTGSYSPLEARCVAIRDTEGELMFFLVADIIGAPAGLGNSIRNSLAAELGISPENVIISGTHTHASVDTGYTNIPSVVNFNAAYIAGMKEAAYKALADLKPAEVYIGSIRTQNMNFVRRYIMDDGSLVGDNAYGTGTKIVRHETDADPELQLMKFVREGGKDILISQFQAHPHLEGKTNYYSSQTVGAIRNAVESTLGVHSLHWNGASGNLNSHSRISSENRFSQNNSGVISYGKQMCTYIQMAYNTLIKAETGKIQVRKVTYTANVNHLYDHMLTEAQMIVDYFNKGNSASASATYAHNLTKDCDMRINSYYHASRILINSKLPATRDMDLVAWSFGDVGGVVLPYEMFDTSGMQVKENSPFARTFIVGYSYPSPGGYIPTREGYANGGYESDNSTFAPGTAEGMVENYLNMLNDMYE